MGYIRNINKKTGFVSVYETQSFVDPVTNRKKNRRIYIGHEDPVTGELIHSSGQPGRRNKRESKHYKSSIPYKDDYEEALSELKKTRNEVSELTRKLNEQKQSRELVVSTLETIIISLSKLKSDL